MGRSEKAVYPAVDRWQVQTSSDSEAVVHFRDTREVYLSKSCGLQKESTSLTDWLRGREKGSTGKLETGGNSLDKGVESGYMYMCNNSMALPDKSDSQPYTVPQAEVIHLRPLASPPAAKNWGQLREFLLYRSAEEMLKYMTALNIPVNCTVSIYGVATTPLLAAVEYRFLSIVRKLVESGADVNQEAGGFLPISLAISRRKIKIANYLLYLPQIEVNKATKAGNTAMLTALQTYNKAIVNALYSKGAKLPLSSHIQFELAYEMKTLLVSLGRDKVVLYLLKGRLKQQVLAKLPFSLVRLLISYV